MARLAHSLAQLRDEIDQLRPGRSRYSDGWIGDDDHQARTSDHNPWVPPPHGGVVTAIDVTDDRGTLSLELAELLRAGRDERIKYVIGERRMFSSYPAHGVPPWTWRPYSGPNAHTSHLHVSVQADRYDDVRPWGLVADQEYRPMRPGDTSDDVRKMQLRLHQVGHYAGELDGIYGEVTEAGVLAFQEQQHLEVTGEVSLWTAVHLQAVAHGVGSHRAGAVIQ